MQNNGRQKASSNTDLVSVYIYEVLKWNCGIFAISSP
jgi:hypothetical protein